MSKPKIPKLPLLSEHEEQKKFLEWFAFAYANKGVNKGPVRILSFANGGLRNIVVAKKMKDEGLKKGAPYMRELEEYHMGDGNPNPYEERKVKGNQLCNDRKGKKYYENAFYPKTLSWKPSCECNADVVPCNVLDIFGGSGTTMVVSRALNRSSIMIELNPAYVQSIRNKLRLNEQLDVGVCKYEIKTV